jgi:hypothetical protein
MVTAHPIIGVDRASFITFRTRLITGRSVAIKARRDDVERQFQAVRAGGA